MASSPSFTCSTKSSDYDTCVLKTKLMQLENMCLPIFMEVNEIMSTENVELLRCKTFQESKEAFFVFQSMSNSCKESCTQVEVGIITTPVSFVYTDLKGKSFNAENTAYYFTIPQEISLSEFHESFSFISLIGNVGGWMGLLIGFSILGFSELTLETLNTQKKAKAIALRGLLLLGSAITVVISVSSCLKLAESGTGSDINIESDFNNMSFSMCSLESIYPLIYRDRIYGREYTHEYIGEDKNFWNNNTKLYQKISKLEVWFKNGEKLVLFDASKNLTTDIIDKSINIPRGGNYLETCHTLKLNFRNAVDQVKITARKELVCYIHISGQILHKDSRQGFSITDSSTTYMDMHVVDLYSSSTSLKMNILNLTGVIDNPYNEQFSYDQCILSWISQQANVSKSLLNPREETNFTSGLENYKLERIEHIDASNEVFKACKNPINQLNIKYNKEKLGEKSRYRRSTMDHKNISLDFYLKFPDIAVVNKVYADILNKASSQNKIYAGVDFVWILKSFY